MNVTLDIYESKWDICSGFDTKTLCFYFKLWMEILVILKT